jgi:hypothetical protein
MADKKRFKLTFRQIDVGGPGGTQRALVIAVGPSPLKGWLTAVLAVEDGSMQQKIISQQQFDLSARHEVVMMEVEGELAAPVIYTPERTGL